MRDIIWRHNRLNGVVFSIVEFAAIGSLAGAYAVYYLVHFRGVMMFIASGIALNCAPVIIIGLRQLREARATGQSIGSFWDRKAREQHRRENPEMLRDALVLTAATLLPFAGLLAVLLTRKPSVR